MSWRGCWPHPGATQVIHNYADVPGAIPIPATLSLELGKVIGEQQGNITYRFVSDYPFKGRAPHELDTFEQDALAKLRQRSRSRRSMTCHGTISTARCGWWRRW